MTIRPRTLSKRDVSHIYIDGASDGIVFHKRARSYVLVFIGLGAGSDGGVWMCSLCLLSRRLRHLPVVSAKLVRPHRVGPLT